MYTASAWLISTFLFAETLSDPTLVATVFAPSDDAFTAYLTANNLTAEQLLAAPTLGSVLKFHVVPGVAATVRINALSKTSLFYGLQSLSVDNLPGLSQVQRKVAFYFTCYDLCLTWLILIVCAFAPTHWLLHNLVQFQNCPRGLLCALLTLSAALSA